MKTKRVSPARVVAYKIVSSARENNRYFSFVAPQVLQGFHLEPSDKAFAYLIAQAALTLQITLDEVIDSALRSPKDIKANVRDCLRLSAYEILYLRKAPFAAVDQGVELVRSVAPRAAGVANHVLRRVVESADKFPYGDPTRALEAAARYYGLPVWLARSLHDDLGEDQALMLMGQSLDPAPVWFTRNALVEPTDNLEKILEDAGIEFNTSRLFMGESEDNAPQVLELAHRKDVGNPAFSKLLETENIIVSDLSAQSIVARAVSKLPQNGARVLEIGSGRGTKTMLFQSFCKQAGIELTRYDVMDVSPAKTRKLKRRIENIGGVVTAAYAHDATLPFPGECAEYDLVFIDAPCTGVGTLRRHPEIRARLEQEDSAALAHIGSQILTQASKHVAPGGTLVYSTCTVFTEENDRVVENFLSTTEGAGFSIEPIGLSGAPCFKTPITPNGPDIHFCAILRRRVSRD